MASNPKVAGVEVDDDGETLVRLFAVLPALLKLKPTLPKPRYGAKPENKEFESESEEEPPASVKPLAPAKSSTPSNAAKGMPVTEVAGVVSTTNEDGPETVMFVPIERSAEPAVTPKFSMLLVPPVDMPETSKSIWVRVPSEGSNWGTLKLPAVPAMNAPKEVGP